MFGFYCAEYSVCLHSSFILFIYRFDVKSFVCFSVSEDSAATCVPTYEDVQSSLPDLCDPPDFTGKSIRCPQTRELPQIPPDNRESVLSSGSLENDAPLYTEGPYEVLKDSSSHDNIIEDCLYETVKELKDISSSASLEESENVTLGAAQASPVITERRTEAAVEYASVDHNRKSRHSINTQSAASTPTSQDEDIPPPLPKKLLDENENVQGKEVEEEKLDQEGDLEGASQDDKASSHGLVTCRTFVLQFQNKAELEVELRHRIMQLCIYYYIIKCIFKCNKCRHLRLDLV